jgi:5-methylcytosine-specific restriction endonuclease McrA
MESTSARDIDRRLADLVRSERHLVVQFVVELAGFAKRDLYRELGYTSLFYYCVRQLGLSKSSAFRRSEAARLIARFPSIAGLLGESRLSIRSLVELREVLTEENHAEVLARAAGMSQEEAQLLAVELKPRPVPRDVVRVLPMPLVSAETNPGPPVPAGTETHPRLPEVVKPLTPDLRRLNVTVSADFMAELEQVRAALSHKCPDGDFEQVVREAFKLVLERDRKRKALTDRPRTQSETPGENDRYVPAAVKRAVWERDQGRCTWPMGDGEACGSTHRLEFDHDLEVALGGKPTIENVRLLCKSHNLMKAEQRLGRSFMAKFRKTARPGETPV